MNSFFPDREIKHFDILELRPAAKGRRLDMFGRKNKIMLAAGSKAPALRADRTLTARQHSLDEILERGPGAGGVLQNQLPGVPAYGCRIWSVSRPAGRLQVVGDFAG